MDEERAAFLVTSGPSGSMARLAQLDPVRARRVMELGSGRRRLELGTRVSWSRWRRDVERVRLPA